MTLASPYSYAEDASTTSILHSLETIAAEVQATSGPVALAWTLTRNAFPIIGARTINHLLDAVAALNISLSTDQITKLNNVSAVSLGYPHDLLKTVKVTYWKWNLI